MTALKEFRLISYSVTTEIETGIKSFHVKLSKIEYQDIPGLSYKLSYYRHGGDLFIF